MYLVRLNSGLWHISDSDEAERLGGRFAISAGHVVDERLGKVFRFALGIHVLNVPELVGIVLHIVVSCLDVINLQDRQTRLFGRCRGRVADRARRLLYVLYYSAGTVSSEVRGTGDRLNGAEDVLLEGRAGAGAGRAAHYDDWQAWSAKLAPVRRLAAVDLLELSGGEAGDASNLAVEDKIEDDDRDLVIDEIFLTRLREDVGVADVNAAVFGVRQTGAATSQINRDRCTAALCFVLLGDG